jgi:hypothetical protein
VVFRELLEPQGRLVFKAFKARQVLKEPLELLVRLVFRERLELQELPVFKVLRVRPVFKVL